MTIWRLIPHHLAEKQKAAYEAYKAQGYAAVGWNDVGDLHEVQPSGPELIAALINKTMSLPNERMTGGPSLWRWFAEVEVGDFLIVAGGGVQRGVFEVLGPYEFRPKGQEVYEYNHVRQVRHVDLDARELWAKSGGVAKNSGNIYAAVIPCGDSTEAAAMVFKEGAYRFLNGSIRERNAAARKACLDEHGYDCAVCAFNFGTQFGSIGARFIHVHHRQEISRQPHEYVINPGLDLIPLCPNCHAMAHRRVPAFTVEELRSMMNNAVTARHITKR